MHTPINSNITGGDTLATVGAGFTSIVIYRDISFGVNWAAGSVTASGIAIIQVD
jgi:hypothetical protein